MKHRDQQKHATQEERSGDGKKGVRNNVGIPRVSMARETPAQAFKLISHNSRLFSWL